MKVAILGAGLLGQRLRDTFAGMGIDATMLGHADFEIRQPDSVKRALDGYDVAVNTVALHKLLACENDPMLARLVNADASGTVASILPTVYISTDYVFSDNGPHDETLPGKEPRSVYGRTKLAGEMAALEHGGIVVRVSGLFDPQYRSHKGPSFPELVTSSFDTLKLPSDQRFSPTYAPDAAARIAVLAHKMRPEAREFIHADADYPTGIYHAANAGSTSWAEFAEQVCEVAPWKRHVIPFEAKDPLRPTNSVLRSKRLPPLRHFRLALDEWALEFSRARVRNAISPKRSAR